MSWGSPLREPAHSGIIYQRMPQQTHRFPICLWGWVHTLCPTKQGLAVKVSIKAQIRGLEKGTEVDEGGGQKSGPTATENQTNECNAYIIKWAETIWG